MENVLDRLLQGPPWGEYRTRLDLLGQAENEAAVRDARRRMAPHPQVQELLAELGGWPGPAGIAGIEKSPSRA